MALVAFKFISLTKDYRAKCSVDDYPMLRQFAWRAHVLSHTVYAITNVWKTAPDGRRYKSTVSMHRMVTGAPPYLHVDHVNRKGLDNRRENLRSVTVGQNNENRDAYGVVKFRGVTKEGVRYRARITDLREGEAHAKRLHLGSFPTAEEAARAYDRKAIEIYGDFFGLNFPRTEYSLHSAITHPVDEAAHMDIPF